jgi:hypothetical protein
MTVLCTALALAACGEDTGNNGNNQNGMTNNANGSTNGDTGGGGNGETNANNMSTNGAPNGATNAPTNNDTTGTNNQTTDGYTAETWGTRLFETYCEAAFDCPGTGFWIGEGIRYLLNTYETKDACLAAAPDLAAGGLYNDADFAAAFSEGRATFDEQVAEGCMEAIKASICGEDFAADACDGLVTGMVADDANCVMGGECAEDGSTCASLDTECYGTCGGTVCGDQVCPSNQRCDFGTETCVNYAGDGEACELSGECDPSMDLACNYDPDAASGTCVAEGSVAAGEFCANDSVCAADHYCADDDTCQPDRQDGESCGFGECAEGLVCNYDFDASMGTCVAEESVAQDEFCYDSTVCAAGLYCDISEDVCKPADKAAGEDCVFDLECDGDLVCNFVGGAGTCAALDSLADGEGCDRDALCMTDGSFCDFAAEACTQPAADGETCTGDRPCAPGLACLNRDTTSGEGTCGALLGQGETCQDFTQCAAPLSCIEDTCSAKKANGESCTSDLDCESFSCSDAGMCEAVMVCMLP